MAKKIGRFEDLEVWKDSMRLAGNIYKHFSNLHDYGFRDQIQRATVSVPSNIAEGYERQSNKEFIQFLYIARGSCGELRTQLYIAIEINLIEKAQGLALIDCTRKISAMLSGLIKTRKDNF
jgi:four helix bundle protein